MLHYGRRLLFTDAHDGGSFLLGKECTTDYDLFFRNKETMDAWIKAHESTMEKVSESDTQITFIKKMMDNRSYKIQLIKLYYPSIQECLN